MVVAGYRIQDTLQIDVPCLIICKLVAGTELRYAGQHTSCRFLVTCNW
jgi:hypothetical protein